MASQRTQLSWPGGASSVTVGPVITGASDTLVGSIWTDQAGTLYIEQSGDNIHWDVQSSYAITASTGSNPGSGFTEIALLAYAQVRFVPTSTLPTVFRLYVNTRSAGTQM